MLSASSCNNNAADIWMKSISGIQLAEIVREINPNVKVLLLTGSEIGHIESSKISASPSIDGFLQKPISVRKLADKILALIGETKGS